MSVFRNLLGKIHFKMVFQRRVQAISRAIYPFTLSGKVLDVGSGNGMLSQLLMKNRSDIQIIGVDVHLRIKSYIPTALYQDILPFQDNTFSSVIIIDVLHHTSNPIAVIQECLRVTQGNVIIKDHFAENSIQFNLLKFMDWVGNRPHGVALPYKYFSREEWTHMISEAGAYEHNRMEEVPDLYPSLFYRVFGNGIQFVAEIRKQN